MNTEGNYIVIAVFVQITGLQEEGLKVRTRPPICGPVKTQRAWLSAHGKDWTVMHKAQTHVGKAVIQSMLKYSLIKKNKYTVYDS